MDARGPARAVGAVVVLAVSLLLAVPLGAQEGAAFPAPVVAPVTDADPAAAAAVVAFYRDPEVPQAEPVLIVQLASPVGGLPDGTRVAVLTGDPSLLQRRTSLVVEGGAARGEVEEGDAAGFTPLADAAPPQVEITPEGWARIGIEPSGDTDLVWVETETPDGTRSVSPIFPLSQVLEAAGPGALTPAPVAAVFGADNAATGEYVDLGAVPTLEVLDPAITVRTTQPIPTEVDGVPVVEVRDFLRIVPSFGEPGGAPYVVDINHTAGTVTFADASSGGFPVAVDAPEETWLVDGLDAEDDETASVTLDRAGLLAGAGLDPEADVGVGVSRAVVLEDGRYVTAEGPVAQLSWFQQGAGVELPTETTATAPTSAVPAPTVTIAETSSEGGGPNGLVVVVAALVALVLAGVALYASRQNRKALGDPDSALGAMAKVVDKTSHDQPDGEPAAGGDTSPRRPVAPTGVRVPAPRERAVADAVGVKGARAAVSREAQARAAARDQPAPVDGRASDGTAVEGTAGGGANDAEAGSGEVGRDALWAAMRKKAAESEQPDEADDDESEGDEADGRGADDGAAKTTTPDDALDALNRFIEDLRLPGDR